MASYRSHFTRPAQQSVVLIAFGFAASTHAANEVLVTSDISGDQAAASCMLAEVNRCQRSHRPDAAWSPQYDSVAGARYQRETHWRHPQQLSVMHIKYSPFRRHRPH